MCNMDAEAEQQHRRGLREFLERDLRELADAGVIPDRGTRDIRFRLNADGRIAWFEATRVRVPASELEQSA